jgi:hypothetical protein
MEDAGKAPEEEEFGQVVVLTKRIRGVLRNYPEGTSVLKELLQNADDAQATGKLFHSMYTSQMHKLRVRQSSSYVWI